MESKLNSFIIQYTNSEEFHILKREIFGNEIYRTNIKKTSPKILDLGAHIGMATLYFKRIYPEAFIICLEPNPQIFQLLETNIQLNRLTNITLINEAVSNSKSIKPLYVDKSEKEWFSTAGFIPGGWSKQQETTEIKVKTCLLSELIMEPIDILKIDIEGEELKVLREASNKLQLVENILLEYHPIPGNDLSKIIELLKKSGFKLEFEYEGKLLDENKLNQYKDSLLLIRANR